MNNYQYAKSKSGIHLGSGVQVNWSQLMQTRLTGGDPAQGIYPAALVVLSNNLYTYSRTGTACANITVSDVTNQALYDYIKNAAQHGTKVIVRIYPSPGNFEDTFGVSGTTHLLMTGAGQRPVGPTGAVADYCSDPIPTDGEEKPWADYYFRSIDDIANEIIAIRNYNQAQGWDVYAFEPANEPNAEWWSLLDDLPLSDTWIDMDTYFKNLYTLIHSGGANPDIRVLAVPMAQSAYAEAKNVIDCTSFDVEGREGGLLWMEYTWLENVNGSPVNYNDGWAWHNYWRFGEESATADNSCNPASGHNFQAFPDNLKATILSSPDYAFITEADVYASCQPGDPSPLLPDKGEAYFNDHSARAAGSAKAFIQQELGADYIAIWNLTNQSSDSPTCNIGNDEQAWHEAFRGKFNSETNNPLNERYWFRDWWLDTSQP